MFLNMLWFPLLAWIQQDPWNVKVIKKVSLCQKYCFKAFKTLEGLKNPTLRNSAVTDWMGRAIPLPVLPPTGSWAMAQGQYWEDAASQSLVMFAL